MNIYLILLALFCLFGTVLPVKKVGHSPNQSKQNHNTKRRQ